jgi:hypothetical protein
MPPPARSADKEVGRSYKAEGSKKNSSCTVCLEGNYNAVSVNCCDGSMYHAQNVANLLM